MAVFYCCVALLKHQFHPCVYVFIIIIGPHYVIIFITWMSTQDIFNLRYQSFENGTLRQHLHKMYNSLLVSKTYIKIKT